MLPAAWRKMCVSSATGTARAATSSANGLPAPTGASWSASPTSTTCVREPTARSSVTSSSRLAIEVSSTISSRASSTSTVGPWPGIQPSAAWTVEASSPVDSAIRRAARPVGATSSTEARRACAAAQISLIVAVLPVPGPARDDREPGGERGAHRGSLLGRGDDVGRRRLGERLEHRLGAEQRVDLQRELRLERGGRRAVGPDVGLVGLEHQRAVVGHRAEEARLGHGAEQRARAAGELGDRQARRALPLGLGEHVQHGRARPGRRVGGHPGRPRDRVRGGEADAEHAREVVRALADDRVRLVAVLLLDPRHEPGEPVRREQQVQRAGGPQGVPRPDRLVGPPRVEPRPPERAARVMVDHREDLLAVAVEQLLRAAGADVADALEVGEQRGVARRRQRLGLADAHLEAEAPVLLPGPAHADALARLEVRERADEDELVAVAVGVDDGEAGLVAGPAEADDRDLGLEGRAGRALDDRVRPG